MKTTAALIREFHLHREVMFGYTFWTVYPDVLFGKDVRLGSYITVESGCVLGDGLLVGNCVTLRRNTVIGDDCKIGHNTVIEGDCSIGDRCSIQANCYIPRGTVIEDDVLIGPGVTGSNDRRIWYGRAASVIPHVNKSYTIKRGVRVGAGACILPVTIGSNAFVGAGAVVTLDVREREIVVGNPAKQIGFVPLTECI